MKRLLRHLWPYLKKYDSFLLIGFLFSFFPFIVLFFNWHPIPLNFVRNPSLPNAMEEADAFFYFLSGTGAMLLPLIAWFNLRSIKQKNEAEFLLHIDDRWGNTEIIKARVILHTIYLEIQNQHPDCSKMRLYEEIARKIEAMSQDPQKITDFIYIINLLDFMETIGYLEERGYVQSEELNALCGESIVSNYELFESYIKNPLRRKKPLYDNSYKNFESLYQELSLKLKRFI